MNKKISCNDTVGAASCTRVVLISGYRNILVDGEKGGDGGENVHFNEEWMRGVVEWVSRREGDSESTECKRHSTVLL